jgi:putative addiction module antidote
MISVITEDGSMFKLKVTTVGNSTGVVLPREVLSRLKVTKGDVLYLTESQDGYKITPYDEEFAQQMEVAERVLRENRDVLRELAKLRANQGGCWSTSSSPCRKPPSPSTEGPRAFAIEACWIPPWRAPGTFSLTLTR